MKKAGRAEYFEEVETEAAYNGYYYSAAQAVSITVLGSLCGLLSLLKLVKPESLNRCLAKWA